MNQRIEQKLQQYTKKARSQSVHIKTVNQHTSDNLTKVIRNSKDANTFMAELEAIGRSGKK